MAPTELMQSTHRPVGLDVSVSAEGEATVVTLRGEADLATLPVLVAVLARVTADGGGAVVVDLARLEFIDTGSVRVLARAWQSLGDRGRELTLRSPARSAIRLVAFFGLSRLVEPVGTTGT